MKRNSSHTTDTFKGQFDAIKPGDTITMKYGIFHGEESGKAYGKFTDRWGKHVRVKMETGRFEIISGITETGIGSYWTPDSPLRRS